MSSKHWATIAFAFSEMMELQNKQMAVFKELIDILMDEGEEKCEANPRSSSGVVTLPYMELKPSK